MKKFLALVVLLVAAAIWVRRSPEFSYFSLRSALERGDLITVEEHVDLDEAVTVAGQLASAATEEAARDAAGDAAAKVASLLGGLFKLAQPLGAPLRSELEGRISRKELAISWGPFVPGPALQGVMHLQRLDNSALVQVDGTCGGRPASLTLVMERGVGPLFGLISDWRVSGVDKGSLPAFAKTCLLAK